MADQEILKKVKFFRGLRQDELSLVQDLLEDVKLEPGSRVFMEGDEADYFYFVKEGEVDLRFEMPGRGAEPEATLTTIEVGGAFGWSAFVPPHKYTLSAYCGGERCVLSRVKNKSLFHLFEERPRVGYICMRNLSSIIATRFLKLEDDIARHEGLNVMHKW